MNLDPRLVDLIERAHRALEPLGVPYAVGGALAMAAHGYERQTSDLDVFARFKDRGAVLRALREQGLEVEPLFGGVHYIAYDPAHRDPRIRIDVLVPQEQPFLSALRRPVRAEIAGREMNVFPLVALVAAKAQSDRPEDHGDVAAMHERGMFNPKEVARRIESYDPAEAKRFARLMARIDRRGR